MPDQGKPFAPYEVVWDDHFSIWDGRFVLTGYRKWTLPEGLIWRMMRGKHFVSDWPRDLSGSRMNPHTTWKLWLEEHVGEKGKDWDWRIPDGNEIEMKFRREEDRIAFLLYWNV